MREALILIDIQKGFDAPAWGRRNNLYAENNAAKLLSYFRTHRHEIIHTRHVSAEIGSPLSEGGTEFKNMVTPLSDETIFEKNVNSAFIGTNLEAYLRSNEITNLTICGLTTPHCVSTTVRMAANLGFSVTLAHDACAAFEVNADTSWETLRAMSAEDIHNSAVSHLHGEFAQARATDQVVKA